jgi:predicted RNA binding protein YcfA (HicA-like mRNA interferase family)
MPKLPQISGKKLVKILERDGWYKIGQKGSHLKLRKDFDPVGKRIVTVPMHKTIKKGTLSTILKDSGLDFKKLK